MANKTASASLPAHTPLTGAGEAISLEWPEYLMEALNLGLFMLSACVFGTLLAHPDSRLHQFIADPFARRAAMGLAMGLTAIFIIYSPFGQRSGAHMNPSVTLTYLVLGRVKPWTAVFYVAAQFLGGAAGVAVARLIIGPPLGHAVVNYVVTNPGPAGPEAALAAEFGISMILMFTVLAVSNSAAWSRWTPIAAGILVALYIAFEDPYSGMSMNPARSFGSAVVAGDWASLWIYFVAPPLGMLVGGLLYRLRAGAHRVFCAKLHHHNSQRCIFRCGYGDLS